MVPTKINKKVNNHFGILRNDFLETTSISPVASATDIPNSANNNVPRGAKLIKFLVALLIMNFIPSKLSMFSTATKVGFNSLVFLFTIL